MHPFSDSVAPVLRNMNDGNLGDAAVTAVGADVNATIDSLFYDRHENFGEGSCGGVPPKLGLEHLANAG
jgi:hypothetical protein